MKHPPPKGYRNFSQVYLSDEDTEFLRRKLAAQRGEVHVPQVREEGGSAQKEHFVCIDAGASLPSLVHCSDMARSEGFWFEGACEGECRARRVRDEQQKIDRLFARS